MIRLTILGQPCGKQRARTFYHKQARRIISMTPAKTVNYEALIKQTFAAKYPHVKPMENPVFMRLWLFVLPSKETRRRLDKFPGLLPTVKPDIDNVIKIYADALNGLAYLDDKQIAHIDAIKRFCDDLRPRVEIEIGEYGEGLA